MSLNSEQLCLCHCLDLQDPVFKLATFTAIISIQLASLQAIISSMAVYYITQWSQLVCALGAKLIYYSSYIATYSLTPI